VVLHAKQHIPGSAGIHLLSQALCSQNGSRRGRGPACPELVEGPE
jgi:hypothetical protein